MVKVHVSRGENHPWTGRAGWDLLEILTDTIEELDTYVGAAEAKFWQAWMIGKLEGTPAAVMYKPSGATSAWTDPPR